MRFFEEIKRICTRRIYILLVIVFVLCHLFYYSIGVPFSMETLYKSQLADPELLKNRLWETVFYLHGQPPLYNLYIGIILKFFNEFARYIFWAVNLVLGLFFYLLLFRFQIKFNIPHLLAFILSTIFLFSPTFILFENTLFYSFPVAFLILFSAIMLFSFLEKPKNWILWVFFLTLFLIGGLRSIFHFTFFILVLLLLYILLPQYRKRIITIALLPLFLLLSFYFKNYLLYGKFVNSTWIGMSIYRSMNKFVPPEITKKEVEAGHMSPLALYEPFKNITHYPPEYQDAGKFSHIPILSEKGKVSSEWENFHHYGFIRLSDQFLKDGLYLYTHYPQYYLKRLGYAWFQYFTSAHRALYALVARDNKAIRFIAGIYDYIFYGELPFNMGGMFGGSVYRAPFLFLILGLPVLFIFALWMAFKKPIDKIPINENQRVMLFYMCLVIAYVALVGNALEIPENNRFRFLTDAFYVTIFGLVVQFYILPYFKHNHPPSV